jgi:hypothetical protein
LSKKTETALIMAMIPETSPWLKEMETLQIMAMTLARIPLNLPRQATITTGVHLLLKPQPMAIPVVGKFANEAVFDGLWWEAMVTASPNLLAL